MFLLTGIGENKMKRFNSTLETKHRLEKAKWRVVIVTEEWRGLFKYDLFGCIDVVAYHPKRGWVGFQACRESDMNDHLRKMQESDRLKEDWIAFGFGAELWVYPNKAQMDEGDVEPRVVVIATFKKKGGK